MAAGAAKLDRRGKAPSMRTEGPLWRVGSASVQGAAHEKSGRPCQDAHLWDASRGDLLIAAVADGAGSALMSEVGASTAVRRAVEILSQETVPRTTLDADEWQRCSSGAIEAARQAVAAEARARSVAESDLASTLLLVVAAPGFVAAAQIGDGAIIARDREGYVVPLTAPQTGECINETTFLTSPGAVDAVQSCLWEGAVAGIAALTDGLQMLALRMPEGVPYAPFFDPLFAFLAATPDEAEANSLLKAFLQSPRVRQRSDDDLTLFVATRIG